MRGFGRTLSVLGMAAFGLAGRSEVSVAQTAPAPAPADTSGLQTVVVTAEKRSQDIKDIPTSISAIGGEELESKHIVDYDDLTRAVPGVSFGAQGGEGLTNIEIRGVSSTSGSATVGIYLDEVSLTIKNTYDGSTQPRPFDLADVEVLRGPQGTLYGASSMGGTIRFLTKQPQFDSFETDVTSELSGTKHGGLNYEESAVTNIPVTDNFAIRAGAQYSYDSGYIDNYSLGGNLQKSGTNDNRTDVLKLAAKYKPNDDLTITPSVFYQRAMVGDTDVFYPGLGLWKQDKEVEEFGRDTVVIPSVTVDYNAGFATVTSITSYFWRDFPRQTDGTYYNSDIVASVFLNAPNSPIATLASPVSFKTTYHEETEELRFTSKTSAESGIPIRWVAGLYYTDYADRHIDYEPIPGLDATFQKIYGYGINSPQSPLYDPADPNLYASDLIYLSTSRSDERQYAAYGQTDFDILPNLHGTVGLRYVFAREAYTRYGGGFYDLGNVSPYVETSHYYAFTPKFALNYDLSDTSTLYATAAKGFRLGGPTGPTPVGPNNACSQDYQNLGITNPPLKYDSDKLWSYETGTKATLLDNKLSVDGAIYYINWQNIQQTIDLPICGFNFTSNVGNAESYGAELEVRYKPISSLTFGLNAGGDHAIITSSNNPATAAVGEKILNTPDWTADISAKYNWPINDKMIAFVETDYNWVGRSHGSYVRSNPDFTNPQYDVLNLSVGVDAGDWQATLYVKNLGDDETIIQRPLINSVIEGYTVRPLTVGLNVAKQF